MHRSSTVQSDQQALLCPHTVCNADHHTAVRQLNLCVTQIDATMNSFYTSQITKQTAWTVDSMIDERQMFRPGDDPASQAEPS